MTERGHTAAELLVVAVVIGAIVVLTIPAFLRGWQASTLRAGAEELISVLGGARQLAINENRTVCVTSNGTAVQYRVAGCTRAPWTGPGTDGDGLMRLAGALRVSAATADITYTHLGAVGTGGTLTVLDPASGNTLCVVVAVAGRASIASPRVPPVCP
jgi:Tfp pilus assembly protein FimT